MSTTEFDLTPYKIERVGIEDFKEKDLTLVLLDGRPIGPVQEAVAGEFCGVVRKKWWHMEHREGIGGAIETHAVPPAQYDQWHGTVEIYRISDDMDGLVAADGTISKEAYDYLKNRKAA